MKFSEQTTRLLKSFSQINDSIVFKPGTVLKVSSPSKNILAKAPLDFTIETEFAIREVSKLLGVLSLFQEPEVTLGAKSLIISQGRSRVSYTYAGNKGIVVPPDYDLELDPVATFSLSADTLSRLMKSAAILKVPEVVIRGRDGKLTVSALDKKNASSDEFLVDVGESSNEFATVVKAENLKVIPGDYSVSVGPLRNTKNQAVKFTGAVEYWIAAEAPEKTPAVKES